MENNPACYKNGYKAGKAFVIAAIPMLLLMVIAEGAVHIPALLAWLDSYAGKICCGSGLFW